MEGASGDWSEMFNSLPDDCISNILSFTSPRDTCSFATLSSLFQSATESDQVWSQFIPSNYYDMLSRADAPISIHFFSKKDLFFRLCDPILIDGGKNSIALDKKTGKICYMISAKELANNQNWEYPALPESRFTNVVQHVYRWGQFHMEAELRTTDLSENTTYVVYLVYKLNIPKPDSRFFDDIPDSYIGVGVVKEDDDYNFAWSCLVSKEYVDQARKHLLEDEGRHLGYEFEEIESRMCYFPKERESGQWMEVALGEFFNENEVGREKIFVEFNWWVSVYFDLFIIEGIEFKPKS